MMQPENEPQINYKEKVGEGVFKVELKLESDLEPRTYAVKCFRTEEFRDREFETHEYIAKDRLLHDSIIQAYTTRTLKATDGTIYYCIVLELEGGSLADQLATDGPALNFSDDESHLMHVRGLIGALCFLHKLGAHYDLKPANILAKRSGPGYVLIDFGVFVKNTLPVLCDKSFSEYSALHSPNERADGKADVWSLACVLLELLIWGYLGGKPAVDEFRNKKKAELEKNLPTCYTDKTEFFYVLLESGEAKLNPAVEQWLKKLGDVCQLVPLLQGMLNIDPEKRLTAVEALNQFAECIKI
jgi:serine/threonine protein kinase